MTTINKLVANTMINPDDSFPLWDTSNGRTRRITGETLLSYITEKNIAENGVSFDEDGNLIITLNDGSTINAGPLPKSVLTVDGVKTDDVETGKFLRSYQNPQPMSEDGGDVVVIDVDTTYEPWKVETTAAILLDVVSIDSIDKCGIEYRIDFKESEVANVSFHLSPIHSEGAHIKIVPINMVAKSKPVYVFGNFPSGNAFSYNVTHSTVFSEYNGEWRAEESSQLLSVTSGVMREEGNEKRPIHAIAIKPDSNLTQEITEDGVLIIGDDENFGIVENPTFKSVSIDTMGSGNENFKLKLYQDNELHAVLDATRELRINYKDISTGLTTAVFGINNNQAQFLVPIYVGNDIVALSKDIPNTGNFIQKHTNAELNKLFLSYQGKYGDNRVHYPVCAYQDVNGWTQCEFTGNMLFKTKNKDTGSVGDKVFELRASGVVVHKKTDLIGNSTYSGDTSSPKSLINREALDNEVHKEWFDVANGTLTTNGNRPTGESGVEGELAVWHNVTSDSTTDPANELKIVFDGAYEKVDGFSNPLRFRLSQQGGVRNQYWTVDDNGWQTEGNVWHLSASKVTGDNLVIGIDTTVQSSSLFLADVSDEIDEKISSDKAKGEWIGGVFKDTINDEGNPDNEFTCDNPKHWLEYRKTTFQGDYALIVKQGNTPISSEITIHLHPSSGMNSTQFKILTNDGKESVKTVRLNEKWRFFLRKGTWPYYERIDDGSAVFDVIDTSSFESNIETKKLVKRFEEKDLVSIPIEIPEGFEILVSSVICKTDGKIKKQPFEYEYLNGILRVHLNEVCTGVIIAELIK